jgi:hypothetical protein
LRAPAILFRRTCNHGLYTDGVTEAANENDEEFGERRLAEQLRAHACLPHRLCSDPLFRAFSASGKGFQDDVTLVAARYIGSGTAQVTRAFKEPPRPHPKENENHCRKDVDFSLIERRTCARQ